MIVEAFDSPVDVFYLIFFTGASLIYHSLIKTSPKTIHVTDPSLALSHHLAVWNDGGGDAFSGATMVRACQTALARLLGQGPEVLPAPDLRTVVATEVF